MIGMPEVIFIGFLIVLLFGAKRIPELASGIGKGIKELRKVNDSSGKDTEPKESLKK